MDYLIKRTTPETHSKKNLLNSVNPILPPKKESFDSSINGNLRVFQNHTKQPKNYNFFHNLSSLGLNEPP